MRTILFRGKRADNGKWVYGDLSQVGNSVAIFPIGKCENIAVIPETIGQFTDKTDKSGKKIFSGDICQLNGCGFANQREIIQDKGDYFAPAFSSQPISSLMEIDIAFEIIGNIHDNPELIK